MNQEMLIAPSELTTGGDTVLLDCRFSLADPDAGRADYQLGHIPGAHYLDLNRDLSAAVQQHGGRHPLPAAQGFAATLARCGVGPTTPVVAYDDSRLGFAARLWWMMRAIGYRPPRLLDGGYRAWLREGGDPDTNTPPGSDLQSLVVEGFTGHCNIDGLRLLQEEGAVLVDSREERRYRGLEEPIDPVAGHIPGAVNRPWQAITEDSGRVRPEAELRRHWGDLLQADPLVVYCGSGVTACVNLFALHLMGREDATLYAGSWSDWCSHL